jgi:hypothetical protein
MQQLDTYRVRLEAFADASCGPPMLTDEQQKRFVRARRLHRTMTRAVDSTTSSEAFAMASYTSALEQSWWRSRSRVNTAALKKTAAARREASMTTIDISKDIAVPLSSETMLRLGGTEAQMRSGSPPPSASSQWHRVDTDVTLGELQLMTEPVMHAATTDDELSAHVAQQRKICKGCLAPLKKPRFGFGAPYEARFCHYTGYYYCKRCHSTGELHAIPARCLALWDFRPQAVCDEAAIFLQVNQARPSICISAHRPSLYHEVPLLQTCRQLRLQLQMLAAIGADCGRFHAIFFTPPPPREMKRSLHGDDEATSAANSVTFVPPERRYLLEDSERWTLRDLQALHEAAPTMLSMEQVVAALAADRRVAPLSDREATCPLLVWLRRIRTQMLRHVCQACPSTCYAVAAKACGACTVDEVIFSFDVEHVVTCPRCDTAYHKRCWTAKLGDAGCPNCVVEAGRRSD